MMILKVEMHNIPQELHTPSPHFLLQTWAPPKMLQRRREAVFHSAAAAYRRLEPIFPTSRKFSSETLFCFLCMWPARFACKFQPS